MKSLNPFPMTTKSTMTNEPIKRFDVVGFRTTKGQRGADPIYKDNPNGELMFYSHHLAALSEPRTVDVEAVMTVDQAMEAHSVWHNDEFDAGSLDEGQLERLRSRFEAFALSPRPEVPDLTNVSIDVIVEGLCAAISDHGLWTDRNRHRGLEAIRKDIRVRLRRALLERLKIRPEQQVIEAGDAMRSAINEHMTDHVDGRLPRLSELHMRNAMDAWDAAKANTHCAAYGQHVLEQDAQQRERLVKALRDLYDFATVRDYVLVLYSEDGTIRVNKEELIPRVESLLASLTPKPEDHGTSEGH